MLRSVDNNLPRTIISSRITSGFTIVELLIVVVVIGILAAITIVSYNGISSRANDSAVQSDLNAVSKKLELYRLDNNRYPPSINTILAMAMSGFRFSASAYTVGPTVSRNITYCVSTANPNVYALGALSKSGKSWIISSTDSTPRLYGPGYADSSVMTSAQWCDQVSPGSFTDNYQGYVASDTPAWRTWTGVTP